MKIGKQLLTLLCILAVLSTCSCNNHKNIAVFPNGEKLVDSFENEYSDPVLNSYQKYINTEFNDFQETLVEYSKSLNDIDLANDFKVIAYSNLNIGFHSIFTPNTRIKDEEDYYIWQPDNVVRDGNIHTYYAKLNLENLSFFTTESIEKDYLNQIYYEAIILPDNTILVQYCWTSEHKDGAGFTGKAFFCLFNKESGTFHSVSGIIGSPDFEYNSITGKPGFDENDFLEYAEKSLEVKIENGYVTYMEFD